MAKAGDIILRVGAAFAFIYPPLSALMDPDSWIGYFPKFVLLAAQNSGISTTVLLHGFGLIEVIIGVWILSGKKVFYPCVIATVMLLGIVLFNVSQFEILFRDVSLALLTLGLAVMHYPVRKDIISNN